MITLMICIIICQIYEEIYYKIRQTLENIISYLLIYINIGYNTFECMVFRFGSHSGLLYPEEVLNMYFNAAPEDFNGNKTRDRFYFTFPILSLFLLLRLFIIKEPYFFLLLHVLFFIFYLNDQHLFYTYIYLFIFTT